MTTSPVKTLIDEQVESAERRIGLLIARGQSLPDALGLSPDTRLVDTPIRGAMTIRGGRRVVEVRA